MIKGSCFKMKIEALMGNRSNSLLYLFCVCWIVIPLYLAVLEYSWSKINQGLSFLRQCSLIAFIPHQKKKAVMGCWPHTKDI